VIVAFQGVEGAYSELAAQQFFGRRGLVVKALPEFAAVFRAVAGGRAAFGILPIENSLTGSIHQNFDLLLEHDVTIVGEAKLRVSHNLLANKGARLGNIRFVYSHPQALSQCADFIRKLGHAEPTPYFDTAGSARYLAASGRLDAAAVASTAAARRYGLKILADAIEDNEMNFTRFIVIAKPGRRRSSLRRGSRSPRKTSIVFALKSIPGALYKSLSVFALRDIDLLKIESRPIAGRPWQYMFYLDFATPADPEIGQRAVAHLEEITAFTKVLGTYPSA
jgi:prephenate dehydratase